MAPSLIGSNREGIAGLSLSKCCLAADIRVANRNAPARAAPPRISGSAARQSVPRGGAVDGPARRRRAGGGRLLAAGARAAVPHLPRLAAGPGQAVPGMGPDRYDR